MFQYQVVIPENMCQLVTLGGWSRVCAHMWCVYMCVFSVCAVYVSGGCGGVCQVCECGGCMRVVCARVCVVRVCGVCVWGVLCIYTDTRDNDS